jgi:arylsulfatase B
MSMLMWMWWTSLALVGCGDPSPCGDPAEAATPGVQAGPGGGGNVLIVVLDDVGVDLLAPYGLEGPKAPTPTLDCLCERGMRFDRAWSTPLCSPSRAALLTGRSADKTGLGHNVRQDTQLDHGEVTIAELALRSGLHTGFVGKWHLDGWESPGALVAPLAQGFESFRGTMGNLGEPGAPRPTLSDGFDYRGYWRNVNGEVAWSQRYATTQEVDDALDFLDEVGDEQWLLVLSLHAAHVPLHDPPRHLLSEGLPRDATDAERFRAVLEAADAELGRLLQQMDPEVLADTTVLVVGDNGTAPSGVSSPFDPDRAKNTMFEGGLRVPLIVTGPHVPRPGVSRSLVHVVDILPTVAEIVAGSAAEPGLEDLALDGVSFLAAMGGDDAVGPARVASVYSPGNAGMDRAIRDDRYKLIERHGGWTQLFDLEADPREELDLLLADALDPEASEALAGLRSALADPVNVPRFDPPAPPE